MIKIWFAMHELGNSLYLRRGCNNKMQNHGYSGPFHLLWKNRRILLQTTLNEIKTRYAGSFFGLAWLVIYPLLFLMVYSFYVFGMAAISFGDTDPTKVLDRILLIFCGLIPFLGFAEALGMGTQSVSANSSLIKNTMFPIELIPVKAVLMAQCTQIVGMAILLFVLAIFGRITLWVFLFPVVWLLQVLLSIGLIWILSSLHVFFKDIQNIVSIVVLMLMFVSPVAWKGSEIPVTLLPIMHLNPLYYLIMSYQSCLLFSEFPEQNLLLILVAISIVLFFAGFWFFERMKRIFSDNV